MSRNNMPQMPKPQTLNSQEAAPAAPALDQPATLIPGFDPNPAGLAENPHVEDPKAVQTDLDAEILHDLELKAGMDAKAPIVRSAIDQDEDAFVKPKLEIENISEKNHSNVTSPKAPKDGFEVKAKQLGFYNQHRLRENEVFKIRRWSDLGDWMELTDPDLEKKHVKEIEERKKAKK